MQVWRCKGKWPKHSLSQAWIYICFHIPIKLNTISATKTENQYTLCLSACVFRHFQSAYRATDASSSSHFIRNKSCYLFTVAETRKYFAINLDAVHTGVRLLQRFFCVCFLKRAQFLSHAGCSFSYTTFSAQCAIILWRLTWLFIKVEWPHELLVVYCRRFMFNEFLRGLQPLSWIRLLSIWDFAILLKEVKQFT